MYPNILSIGCNKSLLHNSLHLLSLRTYSSGYCPECSDLIIFHDGLGSDFFLKLQTPLVIDVINSLPWMPFGPGYLAGTNINWSL